MIPIWAQQIYKRERKFFLVELAQYVVRYISIRAQGTQRISSYELSTRHELPS